MPQYIKRQKPVEAVQWFKAGDHHNVKPVGGECTNPCSHCGSPWNAHGEIVASRIQDHKWVCPGEWVVGTLGNLRTRDDYDFKEEFEPVADNPLDNTKE